MVNHPRTKRVQYTETLFMRRTIMLPLLQTANLPVHKEATGQHSVLPDFADHTTSRRSVAHTTVQTYGACQLRQGIIDSICCSSRGPGVGIHRRVLEQAGMDTCQFRVQITRYQHKAARISEPGSSCINTTLYYTFSLSLYHFMQQHRKSHHSDFLHFVALHL